MENRGAIRGKTDELTKSEGENAGVGQGACGETLGTRQC